MLDRDHPLWQLIVVHGRADGNTAVIWKVHHAMIDGSPASISPWCSTISSGRGATRPAGRALAAPPAAGPADPAATRGSRSADRGGPGGHRRRLRRRGGHLRVQPAATRAAGAAE